MKHAQAVVGPHRLQAGSVALEGSRRGVSVGLDEEALIPRIERQPEAREHPGTQVARQGLRPEEAAGFEGERRRHGAQRRGAQAQTVERTRANLDEPAHAAGQVRRERGALVEESMRLREALEERERLPAARVELEPPRTVPLDQELDRPATPDLDQRDGLPRTVVDVRLRVVEGDAAVGIVDVDHQVPKDLPAEHERERPPQMGLDLGHVDRRHRQIS